MNLKRWRKLLYLLLIPAALAAQTNVNSTYLSSPLTATSQTSAPISLSNRSWSSGTITLTGVSLTTATFGVLGSADPACGSTTFQPIAINLFSTPGTVAATMTATATALYQVNLAGLYCIEYQTSGTFTATSISLLLTASPNAVVGRSGGSSGSAVTAVSIASANGFSGTSSGGTMPALTITALSSGQVISALGYTPPTPPVLLPCTTTCPVTAAYTIVVCTNACTITPLAPAAANQLCVRNSPGAANAITLAALGAGNYYELQDHSGYGTANHTVVSGGVATDTICYAGLDANHYLVWATPVGTWTD